MEDDDRFMGFKTVLGMPTSVLKYGAIKPETEAIYLIIPGNPGVIEYYDYFMRHLYVQSNCTVPVWGISHAGHLQPEDGNQALYNMLSYDVGTVGGQIRHKAAFINKYVPQKIKLFLVGHSIGCYMILKLLSLVEHPVQRCFLLFPTIERMAVSPNGKVFTPALRYFRWLAPMMVTVLGYLPASLKQWLLKKRLGDVPDCAITATLSLLKAFPVSNSLFLANEEMQLVDKLDEDLVRKHLHLLSFYFGKEDRWCPQEYYRDLKGRFPEGDIRLCEEGYSHAYVLDASPEMADIVWDWTQTYL